MWRNEWAYFETEILFQKFVSRKYVEENLQVSLWRIQLISICLCYLYCISSAVIFFPLFYQFMFWQIWVFPFIHSLFSGKLWSWNSFYKFEYSSFHRVNKLWAWFIRYCCCCCCCLPCCAPYCLQLIKLRPQI